MKHKYKVQKSEKIVLYEHLLSTNFNMLWTEQREKVLIFPF